MTALARCQRLALVGFQSLEPFATYTQAFAHVGVLGTYVALDLRKQGVAASLFRALFEAARRKSYEKLFTYIRADNASALAASLKQGFRLIAYVQAHVPSGMVP